MLVKFLNITNQTQFLLINGTNIPVEAHKISNGINISYEDYAQVIANNRNSFTATIIER
jgi:hypothetical protein